MIGLFAFGMEKRVEVALQALCMLENDLVASDTWVLSALSILYDSAAKEDNFDELIIKYDLEMRVIFKKNWELVCCRCAVARFGCQ